MFKYIDAYLLFFGVKIYRHHWAIALLNNLFFVLYVYDLIVVFWTQAVSPQENTTYLSRSTFVLYLLSSLVTQLVMRWRGSRIMTLHREVNRMMTKEVRQRLRSTVVVTHCINSISIVAMLYFQYSRVISKGIDSGVPQHVMVIFWWTKTYTRPYKLVTMFLYGYRAIASDQWAVMSSLVYCYLAAAIEIVKQNILLIFKQCGRLSAADLKESVLILRRVEKLKCDFNDTFNIFPLFSFGFLFVGTAGYLRMIVTLYKTSEDFIVSLAYMLGLVRDMVVLFALNYIVNRHIDHTSSIRDSLASQLHAHVSTGDLNQSNQTVLLLRQMEETVTYDAGGLFTLHKSMLLGFLGGLISFTVMILQLPM